MVGKFIQVNKAKSKWCFITGADGNDYFFHAKCLKDPNDWQYVWNGNECAFQVCPSEDPNKRDSAIYVVPNPEVNPGVLKAQENEKRHQENVRRKKENIQKVENRQFRKAQWDSHCDDHRYWVVTGKKKNSNEPWGLVNPPTVYKNKSSAEEMLYFRKMEFPENTYLLRRCLVYRLGTMYQVKLLDKNNRAGKVIYTGGLALL